MLQLSIITINYNNAVGLQKTMESVIHQNFKDYEYIIIDGASNDGSVDVIKKYADKINYWISEKDTGIYNAMNKGIQKAQGEYLLFLNSGDFLINKDVIQKVFSKKQVADILYGELIFDFGGENKKLAKLPEQLTREYIFVDNIWHPSSFIKRELFTKLGLYSARYKIASDYDFFFNAIAMKKVTTQYLNFPISVYDTGGLSSSPHNLKKINEERNAIHQYYLSAEELIYLNNFKKLKNKAFSKWLVNKPLTTKLVYVLRSFYSKIR